MARLTIFLPDELLEQIDERARELDQSRSSLIREASARYLAQGESKEAEERRTAAVDRSLALFEELARRPSLDGRPSIDILREIRGPLEGGTS